MSQKQPYTLERDMHLAERDTLSLDKATQDKVDAIAKTIDPSDHEGLMHFGAQAQGQMSKFSHHMLSEIQSKDVGHVGDTLSELMQKLNTINPDELNVENQSFLKRIFKRTKASINEVFSKMQSVGAQIDRIELKLKQHQSMLKTDIKSLDTLFDENERYYNEISLYILAAEQRKQVLEQEELPHLREHLQTTSDQMELQRLADLEQFVARLDKRIYDLKLSRQIALQTAPQIRMIQNINQSLAEKIQSSILTSVPLWKNQMAIAVTLMRQRNAVSAQRAVTDTTNELLTKNAEMLHQNAIETAHENERGIVDIDTLKNTQTHIIEMIEETLDIQHQGRQQRQEAEKELVHLEEELKQHLSVAKRDADQ